MIPASCLVRRNLRGRPDADMPSGARRFCTCGAHIDRRNVTGLCRGCLCLSQQASKTAGLRDCLDCGDPIDRRRTRCQSCDSANRARVAAIVVPEKQEPARLASASLRDRILSLYVATAERRGISTAEAIVLLNRGAAPDPLRIVEHHAMPRRDYAQTLGGVSASW